MKNIKFFFIAISLAAIPLTQCSESKETDTEKPVINMDQEDAFPKPCDTIFAGRSFTFKAVFSDNVELGSYNIELHNNFDHHTHGSHTETCTLDPDKNPVNPFYFNQNYEIVSGSKTYNAETTVAVPDDIDSGDYHFMVKLTDKEGWQSWSSVSVKIEPAP